MAAWRQDSLAQGAHRWVLDYLHLTVLARFYSSLPHLWVQHCCTKKCFAQPINTLLYVSTNLMYAVHIDTLRVMYGSSPWVSFPRMPVYVTLFMYLWLCLAFITVRAFLWLRWGGFPLIRRLGCSLWRLLSSWPAGCGGVGSVVTMPGSSSQAQHLCTRA